MRIMIDLDVLHVEFSKKIDERKTAAGEFLDKLSQFEVYTPHVLIDTVEKWRDKELVSKIKNFYELNSKHIISAKEIADKLEELKVDEKRLKNSLMKAGVKDEDALLVIINEILRRSELNEIKINEP